MVDTTGVRVLSGITVGELEHVIDHLRDEDRDEAAAWGLEPGHLHAFLPRYPDRGWTVVIDDRPVFVFGLKHSHLGVYTLWGFGTAETPRAAKHIMRWAPEFLRLAFDKISDIRAKRIEVRVPLGSFHSWRWLLSMGGKIETALPHYGFEGDTFLLLSYTVSDYNVHVQNAGPHRTGSAGRSPQEDECRRTA